MRKSRIAAAVAAAAIGVGAVGVPSAEASSKWSKSQCKSYVTSFKKHHSKATKSQKSAANKTLKSHSCSQKV